MRVTDGRDVCGRRGRSLAREEGVVERLLSLLLVGVLRVLLLLLLLERVEVGHEGRKMAVGVGRCVARERPSNTLQRRLRRDRFLPVESRRSRRLATERAAINS